jgi:predicted PhzF superfamily epimerase YddE/YHI9
LNYPNSKIKFYSHKSGFLGVEKKEEFLFLDFPIDILEIVENEQYKGIEKSIGKKPIELYKGKIDYIVVVENEDTVRNLQPNLNEISKIDSRGLIVTAKGVQTDFVSRYFGPQSGIDEDPVTGSAHTSLLPLWSKKLNKSKLIAQQVSKRGGQLLCELKDDRAIIGGKAQLYLTGEIYIH